LFKTLFLLTTCLYLQVKYLRVEKKASQKIFVQ